MSEFEEIRRHRKDGKVYIVRRKVNKPGDGLSILGAVLSYIAMMAILYGVLSFNRPELIEKVFENRAALGALLFGGGVVLISFTVALANLGRASFEKVNSPEGRLRAASSLSAVGRWALQAATGMEFSPIDDSESKVEKGASKDGLSNFKEDHFSYGAFSSNTPFETHTSNVLKSLSAYATSSEITATKLLDKGVAFMAGGLIFYVLAIVVWQIFANFTHPDPHVMYVGMAACSMTFIVVEFLAAWFFKQYRYYVEVSLSCLRVRSVYDRYLLGYYSLREFKGEGEDGIRAQMTEILKEDVSWPTYKGGMENDFNYMIESMGAAYTSMDKMKGIFQPDKKTKPKAEKV